MYPNWEYRLAKRNQRKIKEENKRVTIDAIKIVTGLAENAIHGRKSTGDTGCEECIQLGQLFFDFNYLQERTFWYNIRLGKDGSGPTKCRKRN